MQSHDFFLTILLFSLIARLPWPASGLVCTLLLVLLWIATRLESPIKIWLKRIAHIVYVPLLYFAYKILIPLLGNSMQDALLQKIDALLIGKSLSLHTRTLAHPFLTEIMYACYMLFFAYVILSLYRHRHKEQFYVGLFTIYWIGFLGYSFLPAEGPYLAIQELAEKPLREGLYCSAPIYDFLLHSNNQADAFPSLHCAISAFCLCFDWKHDRHRFWWFLPLTFAIWLSTIYLGYHYLIDLLAGALLTAFALILALRGCLQSEGSSIFRFF